VRVRGVWDGEAEARQIADEIGSWHRRGSGDGPRKLREVAILVRASFQMRAFEERFVLEAIPYTVVGGPRFFERQEIRDAHAYLRLVQSEDDDLAFERVINTPKRGLGDTSVQKILQLARANGVSASTASRGLVNTDELPARTRTALKTFIRDLDRWRAMGLKGEHHARLTETILEESGYTDMWRADRATGPTRLDNLKELVQAMGPTTRSRPTSSTSPW
jgi:DNA helicase-2/ATP-dependent DNA helicase PcrA